MMDTVLDKLDVKRKIKLSVTLIAAYLKKNYNPTDISRVCNISKQAVHSYIHTHYDELAPLVDDTDTYLAVKSKHNANLALSKLTQSLDFVPDKKDAYTLSTIACQQIDKYQLLAGKPTAIVQDNTEIARIIAKLREVPPQHIDITPTLSDDKVHDTP